MVGLSYKKDSNGMEIPWSTMMIGNAFSLLGAFFYGCYTTFLKLKVKEEYIDMGMFLGPEYLWIFAVMMTSPLVVTLGLSLTIPLTLIGEIAFYGKSISLMYGSGAVIVLIGFLFINYMS
ncbi:hypothetical protein DSO57_1014479 [Entomophthora muscae]|uniref:Uncharacterized protein n=1 Tax=Entomophthora muscae TaxID=34485 RepID=A0ACC2TTI0_9FUNG|nr:hypothetical protein DSO57_1014479 [Entomophthora muscae]